MKPQKLEGEIIDTSQHCNTGIWTSEHADYLVRTAQKLGIPFVRALPQGKNQQGDFLTPGDGVWIDIYTTSREERDKFFKSLMETLGDTSDLFTNLSCEE